MGIGDLKYEVLARYLAGECSAEDQQKVERWIAESSANAQKFKQYKKIWEIAGSSSRSPSFDSPGEWKRLMRRKEKKGGKTAVEKPSLDRHVPSHSLHSVTQTLIRVAAVILIAGLAGLFAYQSFYQPSFEDNKSVLREINTNKGQRANLTLADGTKVMLNADSEIKIPTEFAADVRSVQLNGEAYFEVSKNEEKPFLIHINNSVVRVLGTSFSVRSYPGDGQVQVVVKEGRVSLGSEENKENEAILEGGEIGAFNLKSHEIKTRTINDIGLYLSWRKGYLKFKNKRMDRVAETLERRYDVNVYFADQEVKDLSLTAYLKSRSIRNVLEVISASLDIGYQLESDSVQFFNNKRP